MDGGSRSWRGTVETELEQQQKEEGIHTYRHVCLALAERSACSGVEA